jgi:hypothetical protein
MTTSGKRARVRKLTSIGGWCARAVVALARRRPRAWPVPAAAAARHAWPVPATRPAGYKEWETLYVCSR